MKPTALQEAIKAAALKKEKKNPSAAAAGTTAQKEWKDPYVKKYTITKEDYLREKELARMSPMARALQMPGAGAGMAVGADPALLQQQQQLLQQMQREQQEWKKERDVLVQEMKELRLLMKQQQSQQPQQSQSSSSSSSSAADNAKLEMLRRDVTQCQSLLESIQKRTQHELEALRAEIASLKKTTSSSNNNNSNNNSNNNNEELEALRRELSHLKSKQAVESKEVEEIRRDVTTALRVAQNASSAAAAAAASSSSSNGSSGGKEHSHADTNNNNKALLDAMRADINKLLQQQQQAEQQQQRSVNVVSETLEKEIKTLRREVEMLQSKLATAATAAATTTAATTSTNANAVTPTTTATATTASTTSNQPQQQQRGRSQGAREKPAEPTPTAVAVPTTTTTTSTTTTTPSTPKTPRSSVKESVGMPTTPSTQKSPARRRSRSKSKTKIILPSIKPHTVLEWAEAQRKDKELKEYLKDDQHATGLPYSYDSMSIPDFPVEDGSGDVKHLVLFEHRLYVPAKLRTSTMEYYIQKHKFDSVTALQKHCIWPNCLEDLKEYKQHKTAAAATTAK